MDQLIGVFYPNYKTVSDIATGWEMHGNMKFSCDTVWDIYTTNEIHPGIEKYSGCKDGRVIAKHSRVFLDRGTSRVVTLHDHSFARIADCPITVPCADIFFHVLPNDDLKVLTSTGLLLTFSCGHRVSTVELQASPAGITNCAFWDTGLVFWDRDCNLVCLDHWTVQRRLLSDCTAIGPLLCFEVIPPCYTKSKNPYVIASDFKGQVHVMSENQHFSMELKDVLSIAISPSCKLIGFLVSPATLIVTDSVLEHRLLTYEIDDPPDSDRRLGWIGDDCPVVIFDELALVVFSDHSSYALWFTGSGILFSGTDYAMILTTNTLYKLCFVPTCLEPCAEAQPTLPGAKLVDAFDKRTASSVLALRDAGILLDAVNDCVGAALLVDDVAQQQMLLMAAVFGKTYLAEFDNREFAAAVQIIRQRNVFRKELNVIVPASFLKTLSQSTLQDIAHRLSSRGRFAAAFEYADQVGCDKIPIVTDWCTMVIHRVSDDQAAFRLISQKMTGFFDANSVATIANAANRPDLARQIAGAERNRAKVVPLYIKFRQWSDALRAAAGSYDASLFLSVLEQAIANGAADNDHDKRALAIELNRDLFSFAAVSKYISCNTGRNDHFLELLRLAPIIPEVLDLVVRIRLAAISAAPTPEGYDALLQLLKSKRSELRLPWIKEICRLLKFQLKLFTSRDKLMSGFQDQAVKQRASGESKADAKAQTSSRFEFNFPPWLSANEIIRRLVRMNQLDMAIAFGSRTDPKIEQGRVIAVASAYMASEGQWGEFRMFAYQKYASEWTHIIVTLVERAGRDQAIQFVRSLPDEKKRDEYLARIEANDLIFAKKENNITLAIFEKKGLFG
jgi:hypothetical protein